MYKISSRKSGIYIIVNNMNFKLYVGVSTNLRSRRFEHFRTLKKNEHNNKHLQSAYNKYGKENFEFYVLEEVNDENKYNMKYLFDREIFWILEFRSWNPKYGYNKTYGGEGGSFTDEIKEKLKGSLTKRELTPKEMDRIRKLGQMNKGRKLPPEIVKRMSERVMGEKNPFYGKHHTQESKEKMSKSKIGRKYSDEINKKKGKTGKENPFYGKTHSKETIQKLKELNMGSKSNMAKLNEEKVLEIKKLLMQDIAIREIAKMYEVHETTISNIKNGRKWKHVIYEFDGQYPSRLKSKK